MVQILTTALLPGAAIDGTDLKIPLGTLGLTAADVEGATSDARIVAYRFDRTLSENYNALAPEAKADAGQQPTLQATQPNLTTASHTFSRTYQMTIGEKPRTE